MSSFDSADNESTRPPCLDDLLLICERLNQLNVSYVVVGGVAIFQYGLARLTDDLDFLVDADPVNVEKVVEALSCLPDQACRDIQPTDVKDYVIVRINDEITIDLMGSACGVEYAQAKEMIDWKEVRGVRIPFASPELLWMTKQTHREKDALDRAYLKKWFRDHGREIPGESS